jgi:hypothetical protein
VITSDTTRPDWGLIEALHDTGPAGKHADKLMLFGQFVGSWNLDWTGNGTGTDDRRPATMTGELHFGWVLGGRARPRHLDRPRPHATRRRPAAPGFPRLDDPVLRSSHRRLALHLDRTDQRTSTTLHRPTSRRR